MICFIALIIFGILGIFSASHRKIAKEAFDCVFRRITLRKCTTGLDIRLKSGITSRFLEKSPKLGSFVYKYFEVLSWLFTFLLIGSLVWTGYSGYNYYEYGNCNGQSIEEQQSMCLFDITGANSQITSCQDQEAKSQSTNKGPTLKDVDLSSFPAYQPQNPKDTIVYVGCYACSNTKKVNPTINQLVVDNKETVKFVFIHLPLHKEYEYILRLENCLYSENKVAYWTFHNALMEMPVSEVQQKEKVLAVLDSLKGIDAQKTISCSESTAAEELLQKQLSEIKKMNVEGTPTIFVNDRASIGPKPGRVYLKQLSTYTDWFGDSLIGLGIVILAIILYYAVFKREE
jgi:protein-disulfide isomerase